jgi:hypothetical protein
MLGPPYDCAEVMRQPIEGYVFNESILDTFANAWPAPYPDQTPQQLAFLRENAERKPRNRTNTSKPLPTSFRIGDIGALNAVFKTRLIELGRRNVCKILPFWIEQMHPSRKQYGSYGTKKCRHGGLMACHIRLHLTLEPLVSKKTIYTSYVVAYNFLALFTLAVDLLLQHRLSDSYKRSQEWTTILRGVAKSMPRSAKVVLDSLFSVAQSHEKHVKEYT